MMRSKLAKTNPYLRDPTVRERTVLKSVASSSAIEGIRKPFENGGKDVLVSNMREFIDFWKRRARLGTRMKSKKSGSGLPAIHPGEFLSEALGELELSQAEFARAVGVSPMRVSHVIKGSRPVTAELALLFGRAFAQSPQYWLNLQSAYDLKKAERRIGTRLGTVRKLGG